MREAIMDANVALGEPDHLMREAIRGHQLGPSDDIKTQSRSLDGT
jgi:hypothetical protein